MNSGKNFENDIKTSIPSYIFYHRLNDSTGTFSGGNKLRFSQKQPCDIFLWNGKTQTFFALELKTTKSSSFTYEDIYINEKQPTKMIHKHQITSLIKLSNYMGIISGFIFNFRLENESIEHTYFQNIIDFTDMTSTINKKSFNKKDLLDYNPIVIEGYKKRTKWYWNMEKFLDEMSFTKRDW